MPMWHVQGPLVSMLLVLNQANQGFTAGCNADATWLGQRPVPGAESGGGLTGTL
jgi:hypothetical protein